LGGPAIAMCRGPGTDSAGGLAGDREVRLDLHQLPDLPGRPRLRPRRFADRDGQLRGQGFVADRAYLRCNAVGPADDPELRPEPAEGPGRERWVLIAESLAEGPNDATLIAERTDTRRPAHYRSGARPRAGPVRAAADQPVCQAGIQSVFEPAEQQQQSGR